MGPGTGAPGIACATGRTRCRRRAAGPLLPRRDGLPLLPAPHPHRVPARAVARSAPREPPGTTRERHGCSGRPRAETEEGPPPLTRWAAYSPELNTSEHTFRKARHEAMPQRLRPHERALTAAVHACFRNLRDELVSLHLPIRNAWSKAVAARAGHGLHGTPARAERPAARVDDQAVHLAFRVALKQSVGNHPQCHRGIGPRLGLQMQQDPVLPGAQPPGSKPGPCLAPAGGVTQPAQSSRWNGPPIPWVRNLAVRETGSRRGTGSGPGPCPVRRTGTSR